MLSINLIPQKINKSLIQCTIIPIQKQCSCLRNSRISVIWQSFLQLFFQNGKETALKKPSNNKFQMGHHNVIRNRESNRLNNRMILWKLTYFQMLSDSKIKSYMALQINFQKVRRNKNTLESSGISKTKLIIQKRNSKMRKEKKGR